MFSDEIEEHINEHNVLAAKYRYQVDVMRSAILEENELWEAFLHHLFAGALQTNDANSPIEIDEKLILSIIDFGYRCLGVGAIYAMDGLAQERIVI